MGEKNKKMNGDEQPKGAALVENNKKKDNGGAGGKNNTTMVLKADLHCEGCVSKVLKCIRSIDGVDTASISDAMKITVVGKVDPAKLREKVEQKTHKKVELVSPLPRKENNNSTNKENVKGNENNGGDSGKSENKKKKEESYEKNSKNKSDEKKSKGKELPVTTAVLKVQLHCEGCIKKIYKRITKTKGYQDMKIDRQKELVTVTGAMDMKALAELLKKHLKKEVQIMPPKKEAVKKENDKEKKNDCEKGKNNSGDKGKNGSKGGDGGDMAGGGGLVEENRMQFQVGYPYSNPYIYGSGGVVGQLHYNPYALVHAPQIFSDENPNACSVM